MIKALLRLARAFTGLWGEVRRVRLLIEWLFLNGLTGTATIPEIGTVRFSIQPPNLPPTAQEIAEAEKEGVEFQEMDEEAEAGERAIALLKRRAKGEIVDEDEPGSDWEPL